MLRDEDIIFSKHAAERMIDRGITKEQVKAAIERGAKFRQTGGLLAKYTYFSVAYRKEGRRYFVKSAIPTAWICPDSP